MFSDIKGREIPIGSIVHVRFVVTNEIAAGDPVNLLARLEHPWPGVPEDQRYSLASQFIELVSTPPAQAVNGGTAAPAPPAAHVVAETAPAGAAEKEAKHARR